MKNKIWIWIFLVFIFAISIRVYRLSQKESLFLDEGLSVTLSAYNNYGWDKNFNDNVIYNGKELRELMLWDNDLLSNALSDIIHLRQDDRDSPHTNLYYSSLRLWFAGVKTGNLHRIIVQGFYLNLLFFGISFLFMYKLSKKLFTNNWLIVLIMILAYLNPGSIMNTLYLREYQLQEMLFVLMTYIFVNFYSLIKNKEKIDSWQSMLKIAFLVTLVLLSGYFSLFYVVLLGLILLFVSNRNGQKKNNPFLIFTFFIAFLFAGSLYCKYYDGFFSYRGSEALGKLESAGVFDNIIASSKKYIIDIRGYLISLPAIFLFTLLVGKVVFIDRKRTYNIDKLPLILSASGIICSAIIMFFAPFKGVHYIVSIFPIILLVLPFVISYLKRKEMIIFVFIFSTVFSIKAFTRNEVYYGYLPIEKVYKDNPELPVIVIVDNPGLNAALLSHFTDERHFEFPHTITSFNQKVNKYQKVMVLISQTDNFKEKYLIPSNYIIAQKFQCNWFFDGYILQKNNRIQDFVIN